MKKMFRFGLLFLVVLLLTSPVVRAQGPPTITEVNSQVVVLEDTNLDVKYRLTFWESEPRDKITTIGPFDPGHRILDAHIEHDGRETPVNLVSKGGGFYTVPFGLTTSADREYTVQVHYRVDRPLDVTEIDEVEHRVLAWAPIQWSLYIGEQIVTFILPIELPTDVTQPEQVTDELVDRAAIVVDDANVSSFDRWVYYPTPDEATGKNWLSIYVSKKNVPPEYHFTPKVYIPGRYFAELPPEPVPPAEEFTPTEEPEPAPSRSLLPFLFLFGFFGLLVAGVIVFIIFRLVSPKAAPEEYQAPEIEIETFAQPGVVPDLEAIEAALYIGDTAKVITLVIMALSQRDVLTVLNRRPLQLEVTNPDLEMADYERALVAGIADDGTLPQSTIERVMALLSAQLQTKMWNADPEATRDTYRRRAEDAWDDYRRLDPARRWGWGHPAFPWIILAPSYRPYRPVPVAVGRGPTPLETLRESPMAGAADQMAGVLEGVADNITTGPRDWPPPPPTSWTAWSGGRMPATTPATPPATAPATPPASTTLATAPASTTPVTVPATAPASATAPATPPATALV